MSRAIEIHSHFSLGQRLRHISWGLVLLIMIVAGIGILALYSAGNGNLDPWASRQIARFAVCFFIMLTIAIIDIRFWYRMSYPCYAIGLLMLVAVETMGRIGMGAQRWIDLGFMQLQPSELMRIAVVMAMARYFSTASAEDARRIFFLIPAVLIAVIPVGLVLLQPDLGTSLMTIMTAAAIILVAGAPMWIFITGIIGTAASIPVAWHFLHDYQKQRIRTFLDPESDPLGAGYHITQSKIALGSGGINGKGFLNGTQSNLNFLPEKQTDFIFTLWAEEWGLTGGIFLLTMFSLIIIYSTMIALRCRVMFSRLLALGLAVNFSLYVFVNVAMVMGLIPVVGKALPLVSYGGTAMLAVMIGFGLIMSCNIYRDSKLPRM